MFPNRCRGVGPLSRCFHHPTLGKEHSYGGRGKDRILADDGNDLIDVQEGVGGSDTVFCGPGTKDKVFFDQGSDIIAKNCEIKNP